LPPRWGSTGTPSRSGTAAGAARPGARPAGSGSTAGSQAAPNAPHGKPNHGRGRRSARGPRWPWTDGLTAIGGRHGQRPVFRAWRERIARRERSLLRVAHQDRPCRSGLDGCEDCAETHDDAIRVVNQESLSPQAELVEDPMAVVPTFSGPPSGRRCHGQKLREAATDG